MTQVWPQTPQFKLEVSGKTYINNVAFNILSVHPENNISYLILQVSDYQSKRYVDVFDAFDAIDLSLRYGSDSWTKKFTGIISTASPKISLKGEVLEVVAWGDGNPLCKTNCDESYGTESIDNNAVDTAKEILEDIIDEHVNKIFGAAAASNWSIGKAVDNAHAALTFTSLNMQYPTNFTLINRVCDIVNAYAQSLAPAEASVHWFVDTTPQLMFKKIDADHTSGDWDHYWKGSQAASMIVVKEDMILYDFKKCVEEYANDIVLSSLWRYPVEDYWTEDTGGQALWGSDGKVNLSDSATSIVGSHSLLAEPNAGLATNFWYPSGKNLSLNLENAGSRETIPTIGFYARKNQAFGGVGSFYIFSSVGNYVQANANIDTIVTENDKWVYLEFPVGPYFDMTTAGDARPPMTEVGTMDWTDVNWIQFMLPGVNTIDWFVDDLHFSGVVVREAKDTSEITANNTYMKVMRNNVALDDTLTNGTPGTTDIGSAARLARAELLRRSQIPIVGLIQTPMAVDALPGQTVYIRAAEKKHGTYRINQDMRMTELRYLINENGFHTTWNLTSDVTNTHAFGVPTMYSLLKEYAGAVAHQEARNLKGGKLDNLIPRLIESY